MGYDPSIVKEVDGSNPFIRAYFYLWPIDPDRLNTCYLFWGTVLAPLNALVRLLAAPFYLLLRKPASAVAAYVERHVVDNETLDDYLAEREREKVAKKRRQARWQAILDGAAPAWRAVRFPLAGTAALGVAFLLYLLVRLVVEHPGLSLKVAGIGVGVGVATCAVLALLWLVLDKLGMADKIAAFCSWVATGYWSVKNRTCAKFVVKP